VPVFDKHVFGASDQADIESAVSSTRRPAVVLVGIETDVRVMHSALGFVSRGYRVLVVHDAVFSAGVAYANGLARLRQEGIEMMSAKELYYEWLRDLPTVLAFDSANPELSSPPDSRSDGGALDRSLTRAWRSFDLSAKSGPPERKALIAWR
jgi:hypothetical protein